MSRYRSRISGPLLDRVELLIEVPPLCMDSLEGDVRGESSDAIRLRVVAARAFRVARTASRTAHDCGVPVDGHSAPDVDRCGSVFVEQLGDLTRDARSLLRQALVRESLSGRAYARIINLARTIADLDNNPEVGTEHVAEALSLRLDYRRVELV